MVVSELQLNSTNLAQCEPQLVFSDDLPVVIAYARVSSQEQADNNHSIETQNQQMYDDCDKKFPAGCHLIYIADPGFSGTLPYYREGLKPNQFRPGLSLVVKLIESEIVSHLVVYRCDRLFRTNRIWYELCEDVLIPHHVHFMSATEPVSIDTAAGLFITDILMANACFVRDQIVQVCSDGMRARRLEGYTFSSIPYGWRWGNKRNLRQGERIGIEPNPDEKEAICLIFRLFLSGWNQAAITRELMRLEIPPPKGGPVWNRSSIRAILRNPIHCGLVKGIDGHLAKGQHDVLHFIEEADYWQAQKKLDSSSKDYAKLKRQASVFSEFIHCGLCGSAIGFTRCPSNNSLNYMCYVHYRKQRHHSYSIPVAIVDAEIEAAIESFISRQDIQAMSDSAVSAYLEQDFLRLRAEESRVESEIELNKKQFFAIANALSKQDITRSEFIQQKQTISGQKSRLESRLAEIHAQQKQQLRSIKKLRRVLDLLKQPSGLWRGLAPQEQHSIVSNLIEYAILDRSTFHVTLRLKLLFSEELNVKLLTRCSLVNKLKGVSGLNLDMLTTAYYLLEGVGVNEIARLRGMKLCKAINHRREILKRAGTRDLHKALTLVVPFVQLRRDDLLLGDKSNEWRDMEITPVEIKYMQLLAKQLSKLQIARELHLSEKQSYLLWWEICSKLGAENNVAALNIALDRGYIDGPAVWNNELKLADQRILQALIIGGRLAEAAKRLGMNYSTLHNRVRYLCIKYQVKGAEELVVLAREKGWVQSPANETVLQDTRD